MAHVKRAFSTMKRNVIVSATYNQKPLSTIASISPQRAIRKENWKLEKCTIRAGFNAGGAKEMARQWQMPSRLKSFEINRSRMRHRPTKTINPGKPHGRKAPMAASRQAKLNKIIKRVSWHYPCPMKAHSVPRAEAEKPVKEGKIQANLPAQRGGRAA